MNAELVAGRRALLDALVALGPHAEALILVGAHAVQEWAGPVDAGIGGSPMSKDADLQVNTLALGPDPTLESAMRSAGFQFARGSASRTGPHSRRFGGPHSPGDRLLPPASGANVRLLP